MEPRDSRNTITITPMCAVIHVVVEALRDGGRGVGTIIKRALGELLCWPLVYPLYFLPRIIDKVMRTLYDTLLFLGLIFSVSPTASSAPHGFPTSGNGLWYTQPGKVWSRELLPIGNGYLAGQLHSVTHLKSLS